MSSRTDVELVTPTKNTSNIQCNVDMEITVSKTLQKHTTVRGKVSEICKFGTLIAVLIILIRCVYMNGKQFELQMNELNYNIVQLSRQYDMLNRNLNHICFDKTTYSNDFINLIKSTHELSNLLKFYINDEHIYDNSEKESRTKRLRRDNDPLVATFVGAIPEQRIYDTVQIGPWKKNNRTSSHFDFTKFHLVEDNMSIEVTISGLYIISVQIFYYGESKKCSYDVLLNSEGMFEAKQLVTCITATSHATSEITCHTSVVTYLQKGDRLSIHQRETDRLIDLREGYSHVQLVMLAQKKRR
ncbi:uncharacterized protein LOC105186059 isoform X2 [Harpegnathos saltator]|uniref:uncharacterized protein LOC105186059 isoform X2 n=1 Tax=Harpegnathos saltator TaxID=610380 RepID=UPI000DBEDBB1|nr:uncharacterized protein LOC105186059 isoform X2 [Harpegnathos saltator]